MSKAAILSPGSAVAAFADVLPTLAEAASVNSRRPTKDRFGAEEARKRGHEEGYAAGVQEGREIGATQAYADAQIRLQRLIEEESTGFAQGLEDARRAFEAALPTWFAEAEEKLTDLALAAVRKILAAELQISRDSALEIVREALSEVTHSTNARIRLNPFDSAAVAQHRATLLSSSASLRDIQFVDDASLLGGCIIETDGGVVDASLDTRIALFEGEAA